MTILNTLPNADLNGRGYIRDMIDKYESLSNDNNLVTMNNEATRYCSGVEPSCIDHITTNCPDKLFNINTIKSIFSDHCYLVGNYKNKNMSYKPKKIKIRNHRALTKAKLENAIFFNENLNTIFSHQDPDTIALTLQVELNSIINSIAPKKFINFKKNHAPFLNQEIKNDIKNNHLLLTKAIESKNQEDWRNFRNSKINTNKKIESAKKKYLNEKLANAKHGWKLLNQFQGKVKSHPPSKLIYKDKIYSSPKDLSEILNNHYINKI